MEKKKSQWWVLLFFLPIVPALANGFLFNRADTYSAMVERDNLQDSLNVFAWVGVVLLLVIVLAIRGLKRYKRERDELSNI